MDAELKHRLLGLVNEVECVLFHLTMAEARKAVYGHLPESLRDRLMAVGIDARWTNAKNLHFRLLEMLTPEEYRDESA